MLSRIDKVAHSARASAHTKFQEIAFAYAILSDPTRRDRYDTTGSTSESVSDDFDWKSFFKAQFAETVTIEKLDNLKATYQGSEDEKRDVLDAYRRRKGNLTKMFKDIMLSNPLDDEDRFKSIIDAAIAANEVPPYDAYFDPDQRGRRDRIRAAEREGKEAQELAKKLGVHDALFGTGRQEGQEKKGLANIIQQRQKARAATFLDDLTAKYVNGCGMKGEVKGRKRKLEESEEDTTFAAGSMKAQAGSKKPKSEESEEDPTFTARQRRKGKLARRRAKRRVMDEYELESADDEDIDVGEQPVDEPPEEAFKEGTRPLPFLFFFARGILLVILCEMFEARKLTLRRSQWHLVPPNSASARRSKRTRMLRRA